jgi:hypothetical protein
MNTRRRLGTEMLLGTVDHEDLAVADGASW